MRPEWGDLHVVFSRAPSRGADSGPRSRSARVNSSASGGTGLPGSSQGLPRWTRLARVLDGLVDCSRAPRRCEDVRLADPVFLVPEARRRARGRSPRRPRSDECGTRTSVNVPGVVIGRHVHRPPVERHLSTREGGRGEERRDAPWMAAGSHESAAKTRVVPSRDVACRC